MGPLCRKCPETLHFKQNFYYSWHLWSSLRTCWGPGRTLRSRIQTIRCPRGTYSNAARGARHQVPLSPWHVLVVRRAGTQHRRVNSDRMRRVCVVTRNAYRRVQQHVGRAASCANVNTAVWHDFKNKSSPAVRIPFRAFGKLVRESRFSIQSSAYCLGSEEWITHKS